MAKWFRRKDFIIQRCKFPISVLSPFEKMFCLLFKQTLVSFPKECSVSSIRWSREKKFFYLLSPFGQSLYFKKILIAQTLFVPCWNLSSGSGLNCQCIHKISLLSPLGTDCSNATSLPMNDLSKFWLNCSFEICKFNMIISGHYFSNIKCGHSSDYDILKLRWNYFLSVSIFSWNKKTVAMLTVWWKDKRYILK